MIRQLDGCYPAKGSPASVSKLGYMTGCNWSITDLNCSHSCGMLDCCDLTAMTGHGNRVGNNTHGKFNKMVSSSAQNGLKMTISLNLEVQTSSTCLFIVVNM